MLLAACERNDQMLNHMPLLRHRQSPTDIPRRRRRGAARGVLVALVAAVSIGPAAALGAAPAEQYHDRFTESFSDVVCGIAVDVEIVATNNFFVYADDSVKGTGSYKATLTNPLNGASVVLTSAGAFTDTVPVIDEVAGTITFHPVIKGLAGKIQTANGPALLDAGIIALADTFDLDTGELISRQVMLNKGPHPEADSDFTRSCEVISQALA